MLRSKVLVVCSFLLFLSAIGFAQEGYDNYRFNEQDTLRGSLNPLRTSYDVRFYDMDLWVDMEKEYIEGYIGIDFDVLEDLSRIQLDLFENMKIDKVVLVNNSEELDLSFQRNGNAFFVDLPSMSIGEKARINVHYSGKPIKAKNAPWDGGFSWKKDQKERPWLGVSCEGIGASLWWPNKDHLSEEPDSMRINIRVDQAYTVISNGNLRSTSSFDDGTHSFEWFVSYPINNYNVSLNIGQYVHFEDKYISLDKDTLQCDYYVMDYNLELAQEHFQQVHGVLASFEYFFDKYPFWEDGYALIETPYLGMEHQSGIAYGNRFMRGYLGRMIPADMDWDFIIVHETGHEYFGNSISSKDHAEMWIHESFTTYMEALYVEYRYEYPDVERYLQGQRGFIKNRQSIIAPMGVNFDNWESSDHYYKGSWILHTLRHHMDNDEQWFGLIKSFYKKYAMSHIDTEDFIAFSEEYTGKELRPVINHFLYKKDLPVLAYSVKQKGRKKIVEYKWEGVDPGFDLTVWLKVGDELKRIQPETDLKTSVFDSSKSESLEVDLAKALILTQELD